ncbi:PhzF family phenazine biosynthesis protein [Bailinhaonella thermotolerans]|uniref:PhzF family phenazine biosynthesis protein n=1 Tax=Bailinhaonella thermotolerans TaxID=1070861 RepID=A0A3A4A9T9_9ACTN|nr:PhzF family phenazine biosynthesis protein [Bailinhaonella thermotolerans]RJL23667.1 PhzF family phenazine biosynthesis protein [Bailinhaonella thermotolerans]
MRLHVVDAFTDRPFGGNPAAVVLLDRPVDEAWMQSLAAEMKHSETAYLTPREDGYGLRWFTPAVEVDLCGHATLASAHALFSGGEAGDEIRFHTRSGVLTARRERESGMILLDFPARTITEVPAPAGLDAALGAEPRWTGRDEDDLLVELADEEAVRKLEPDIARLAEVEVRGVTVTARGSGEYDFVSRFFAPRVGVDEDPVTGSAHCALAPYWADRLGRDTLVGFQASARGGVVRVTARGGRVELAGRAVTILDAELAI